MRILRLVGAASTLTLCIRFLRALSRLRQKQHAHAALRDQRGKPDAISQRMRNAQGMYLLHRRWKPTKANGETVVLVHGFGEHSGRYEHVAAALTSVGFDVMALDHQGHGGSEGDRAYFESIWDPVNDLLQYIREVVRPAAGERQVFVLGHSMGGLLSSLVVLKAPELVKGLILSGPAVGPDPSKPLTPGAEGILTWLAEQFPKLPLLSVAPEKVCRTPLVVQSYILDPLNHHGAMTANMFLAFVQGWKYIAEHMESCKVPLLLQHGTKDELVVLDAGKAFFEKYGGTKKMLDYEGWFHEIYNEAEPDCQVQLVDGIPTNQAIRDALTWLQEMTPDMAQSWQMLKGKS